jgi:hypothetical protein
MDGSPSCATKGNAGASLAGAGVTVAPNSGNSASLIGVGMIHRF